MGEYSESRLSGRHVSGFICEYVISYFEAFNKKFLTNFFNPLNTFQVKFNIFILCRLLLCNFS